MGDGFDLLLNQVFAGDSAAAAQLVREYEPEIRRIVRFRLRDPRIRRVIDSTDICQSVFAKFFLGASLGKFDLDSPQDLVKLLARMATNRVIDRYRSETSQRRLIESRSREREYEHGHELLDQSHLPERVAEYRELLTGVQKRLTSEERAISKLRSAGCSWLEVSRQLGSSPHALRKKLKRACDRIFDELGINEHDQA